MKLAVLSLLATSAAAFAPASQKASSSALLASPFAGELGAMAPLGYWDPLGLCKDGDEEKFARLRYVLPM